MKRVILRWDDKAAAAFRPVEEFSHHAFNCDLEGAQEVKAKADRESCGYTGEGEGMGSSFATISEAIAYADFQGDVVLNREAALAEHARRRGWTKR